MHSFIFLTKSSKASFQRTHVVPTCLFFFFLLASGSAQHRTVSLLNSHLVQRNCHLRQLVEPNPFADTLIIPQSPPQSHHTLCLNTSLISCNPVRSSPWMPAKLGLFKRTALLAEDEGLQLEESTVLHHFPFYGAKSCPLTVICGLIKQRETLMQVTPTETLRFQWADPTKQTQQRGRCISM